MKKSMLMLVALFMVGACSTADSNNGGGVGSEAEYLAFVSNHSVYDVAVATKYGDTSSFYSKTVPAAKFDANGNVTIYEYDADGVTVKSTAKATFQGFSLIDGAKYTAGDVTFYISIDTTTKQLIATDSDGIAQIAEFGEGTDFTDTLDEGVLVLTSTAEEVIRLSTLKEEFNVLLPAALAATLTQVAIEGGDLVGLLPLGANATFTIANVAGATTAQDKRTIAIVHGTQNPVASYVKAFPAGTYTYSSVVKENVMKFVDTNGTSMTVTLTLVEGALSAVVLEESNGLTITLTKPA